MTYSELVEYLLKKYGPAKYDYFCTESCKSKNSKVSRTSEGLYCHHIDEDKAIMLSNDKLVEFHEFDVCLPIFEHFLNDFLRALAAAARLFPYYL